MELSKVSSLKVFLSLFARRVDFDLVNMSKDNVTWQTKSILPKPEDGSVIAPRPSSLNENKSRTIANVPPRVTRKYSSKMKVALSSVSGSLC